MITNADTKNLIPLISIFTDQLFNVFPEIASTIFPTARNIIVPTIMYFMNNSVIRLMILRGTPKKSTYYDYDKKYIHKSFYFVPCHSMFLGIKL